MGTLKSKLIISYAVIAFLVVVCLSVLFNISVDKIFENYAINQRNSQIEAIIKQVDEQYLENSGLYNVEGVQIVAGSALQNGIMVHVETLNKEVDWDIRQHKAQECRILLQHAETNMHSRYPNFQGGYREETYDLKYSEKLVGYLTVGYYGPYSLKSSELSLIGALNRTLIILGIFFLGLAVIVGVVMAKRISAPISCVIRASKEIANGDYGIKASGSSTMRETTELIGAINEMSRELAVKEQQKKQITADVAHELRTPLFNLQGNMEAMIDQVLSPTPERLQNCHQEIIRLTKVVDQLQELNVLENNPSLSMNRFDFSNLCKSLLSDFEVAAKTKGVRIVTKLPAKAPLYGDTYRIKQCMMNLIFNALNYTPEGGTITVEYEVEEDRTLLRVRDNGIGISPEDLPHVFERFYRSDRSRSQRNGGVGIGLSITRAIVEVHEGTVSVDSKIGSGTVFTISLPSVK